MAPTFKHGVGTRVCFNGYDMSAILSDSELTRSVEMHETTTYVTSTGGTQSNKTYAPGLKDGSFSMSGLKDGSTALMDGVFRTAMDSTALNYITWIPSAPTIGEPAYLIQGTVTDFTNSSPTADMVAISAEVQHNFARGGYLLLSPLTATTSTGAKTAVQVTPTTSGVGATSTRDAIVHMHVMPLLPGGAASTSTGQIRIQHSSDGASFADLATLSYSSGVSAQASTITTTIKEKVRANVQVHAAAGTDQRIAVAFAFK